MVESLAADLGLDDSYDLADEQIERLHDKGWVLLPGLVSAATCLALLEELKSQEHTPSVFLTPEQTLVRKRESLGWKTSVFRQLGTSRRVGGTAARLMKLPEVLFAQDMTFAKEPGGGGTQFHQDYPFTPYDRAGAINLWIALVDVSDDMGALTYLEGSHRLGPLGRFTDKDPDIRDHYPFLRDLPIGGGSAVNAGDAVVHLDLTVHGSGPNTSDRTREAYACRYAPPETIYTGARNYHFDSFDLVHDSTLESSGRFPRVGKDGLVGQ